MNTRLLSFLVASWGLTSAMVQAQTNFPEIKFWVGTGTDSAVLVVDFHDGTWDSCYAWGFRFNGTSTGEAMLNAVAAADVNFSVAISGGFLNDITYGSHAGIGGTNNFYWSTWSGTNLTNLTMNMGISTSVSHGQWFACSFTDFNPPLPPGPPIPAFDPYYFTAADVEFWVGTGPDSCVLVIDFLDGSPSSAYAWGYRFSGSVTAEAMLQAIDAADPQLSVTMAGGFLNDITYGSHSGIGGNNGNYWGTWSATNLGNWQMNMGINTQLTDGSLFGCSYMNFNPVIRPGYPIPAPQPSTKSETGDVSSPIHAYPNPTQDQVWLTWPEDCDGVVKVQLVNVAGQLVLYQNWPCRAPVRLSLEHLPAGLYQLRWQAGRNVGIFSIVKK